MGKIAGTGGGRYVLATKKPDRTRSIPTVAVICRLKPRGYLTQRLPKKKDLVILSYDQDDALLRDVTVTSTEGYEKSMVMSSAVLLVTSPRRM
jgi:hypothetical protein